MIKDIYLKIVEIVETMEGEGEVLAKVYGYPEPRPELFPCAFMDVSVGRPQEDISSESKFVPVNVTVRVLLRQRNSEESTLQRLDIMDAFLEAFNTRENIDDLDGAADLVDITSIDPLFVSGTADQPLFGFDIIISAKKVMRAN